MGLRKASSFISNLFKMLHPTSQISLEYLFFIKNGIKCWIQPGGTVSSRRRGCSKGSITTTINCSCLVTLLTIKFSLGSSKISIKKEREKENCDKICL